MNLRARLVENWRSKAVTAGITAILGLACWTLPFTQELTHLSYDLPFAIRGDIRPEQAVIVYMDDDSRSRLHQPVQGPWDRALHTRLLNELSAQHARAVVFDVLFDEAWPDKSVDEQFAAVIRSSGPVVLAASCHYSGGDGEPIIGRLRNAVQPLASAAPSGVVELPVDTDGTIRRHFYNEHYTNLAWQTATVLSHAPPESEVPRWINFYGPSGTIPHLSYSQVLNGALPFDAVSNKVVFVGMAPIITYQGIKSTDAFRTPHTRWTGASSPGVEVQATAWLNLLRRDWLSRLPLPIELGVILAAPIMLGFLLPLCRPGTAVVTGVCSALGLAAIALILASYFHWWFAWAVICLVEVPAAFAWLSLSLLSRGAARAPSVVSGVAEPQRTKRFPSPEAPAIRAADPKAAQLAASGPPEVPDHQMLRLFGEGAYGQVWLARNTALGTYRAIKVVFRKAFDNDGPFEREFRGIQAFEPISRSHEGFVHILQVGRNHGAGYFYYVMELADPAPLEPTPPPNTPPPHQSINPPIRQSTDPLIHQSSSPPTLDPDSYVPRTLAGDLTRRGKIPCEECVQIALCLSATLQKIHDAGLVHRDIKPSNIIFVDGAPKLADIGLVARTEDARSYVGTEGFMPPEGPGSAQADIFSLGKVLYELATGRDRLRFPELPTRFAEDPEREQLLALNKILLKACEQNASRRYKSAGKFHTDLKRLAKRLTTAKAKSRL